MKSLGQQIKQLEGLLDTNGVSAWENEFIRSILARTHHGARTNELTPNQVEKVDEIYNKHFA